MQGPIGVDLQRCEAGNPTPGLVLAWLDSPSVVGQVESEALNATSEDGMVGFIRISDCHLPDHQTDFCGELHEFAHLNRRHRVFRDLILGKLGVRGSVCKTVSFVVLRTMSVVLRVTAYQE